MNQQKIAIMIDSGCDLDAEFCRKNSIYVLPFIINYDNEESRLDGVMDPLEVYKRYPQLPKTSMPSFQTVDDTVRKIVSDGYEKLIAIDISPKLSSTISTVSVVLSEHPEIKSFVLDTKRISIGAGMLVMWAAEKINQGISFESLIEFLPMKIKDSQVFFYMDTLEYLKAGGRIGGITAHVGGLLKIRPLITCDSEGKYKAAAIIRGEKTAKKKLLEAAFEFSGGEDCWIGFMNGGAGEEADAFRDEVKKTFSKGQIVADHQITASLAVHTGPGLLGIGVLKNP